MDATAFVQENKRWLIGVALGAVVYIVGQAVIAAVYDAATVRGQVRREATGGDEALYDRDALAGARAEGQLLDTELQRLRAELEFKLDARFVLQGQSMAADDYLAKTGSELKQALLLKANEQDVLVQDKDLSWPSPIDVDGIRSVLFGLNLIDEAAKRLLAAHAAVRKADPEAMGLRSMGLRLEEKRSQRTSVQPRRGEVDVRDRLSQERVNFTFQSDGATAALFLESCRQPGRTLVLESLTMEQPKRLGDPVTVKGWLSGIAFREETPK